LLSPDDPTLARWARSCRPRQCTFTPALTRSGRRQPLWKLGRTLNTSALSNRGTAGGRRHEFVAYRLRMIARPMDSGLPLCGELRTTSPPSRHPPGHRLSRTGMSLPRERTMAESQSRTVRGPSPAPPEEHASPISKHTDF
jgi:hypothetical protein